MCVEEKKEIDNNVFFMKDIQGKKDWMDKVVSKLSKNVYITIDLDVFDSSLIRCFLSPTINAFPK